MHRLARDDAGSLQLDAARLLRIDLALAVDRVAERVDPGLLGGLVAKVGDLVFDGSLRTQLAQLRSQLTGERTGER